ncbi:hypothetical protein [uncultured Friedmanniella sp.]|uniref:hypothetical protein n=1 Tax=uncultured Friedmanniella sp. TaxID=335381 RepID=UPI0035CB0964
MPDPTFPRLHVRPSSGWVNDPNGLCRVDGVYHVFFQLNPDLPTHGDICWGHQSSPDLLHWTEESVALRPVPGGLDAAGCWSGCIVEDDGVPTAIYTAVPEHAHQAVVALARSDRSLRHWQRDAVPAATTPTDGSVSEVRDPFVFTFEGRRYAVQGGGSRTGPPALLLYDATDLTSWRPLGPMLDADDPVAAAVAPAQIWECPNLFALDGRWVLLVSLWRWVDDSHLLAGVRWLVGDLEPEAEGLRFRPHRGGVLDDGPAHYAPQVLLDGDRVLLWGWAWELGRTLEQVSAAGWAGVLTFPRELSLRDETLVSVPAPELTGLRRGVLVDQPGPPLREPAFEVIAAGPVRLLLHHPPGPQLVTEAHGSPEEPARILVDGSLVETFAGPSCWTGRAYPDDGSHWQVEGDPAEVVVHRLGLE